MAKTKTKFETVEQTKSEKLSKSIRWKDLRKVQVFSLE